MTEEGRRKLMMLRLAMALTAFALMWWYRIGGGDDAVGPQVEVARVEVRKAPPRPAPNFPDEPATQLPIPEPSDARPPSAPQPVPDAVRQLLERAGTEVNEPLVDIPVSVWPLTREGIQGAVDEVIPHIRGCYNQAIAEVPDLEGRLEVSFRIVDEDGVGQVWDADIGDDRLQDGPVADCVLDAMEALQFDAPAGGEMTVNYPFVFEQAEGD